MSDEYLKMTTPLTAFEFGKKKKDAKKKNKEKPALEWNHTTAKSGFPKPELYKISDFKSSATFFPVLFYMLKEFISPKSSIGRTTTRTKFLQRDRQSESFHSPTGLKKPTTASRVIVQKEKSLGQNAPHNSQDKGAKFASWPSIVTVGQLRDQVISFLHPVTPTTLPADKVVMFTNFPVQQLSYQWQEIKCNPLHYHQLNLKNISQWFSESFREM